MHLRHYVFNQRRRRLAYDRMLDKLRRVRDVCDYFVNLIIAARIISRTKRSVVRYCPHH